jgi:hypothetical protein
MDPDHAMDCRAREDSIWEFANDIILDMENRFTMASQWSNYLGYLHGFFKTERFKQRKDM